MKKIIFLALISFPPLFFACSSDDEKEIPLSIEEEKLEIKIKNIDFIHANKFCNFKSKDENIAIVSNAGTVTGISFGKTIITAYTDTESIDCQISVIYNYNIYEEPILDFSVNKEHVKSNEKHELASEGYEMPGYNTNFDFPDSQVLCLYYNSTMGNGYKFQYHYKFIDKIGSQLYSVQLSYPEELAGKILLMLQERYGEYKLNGGYFIFNLSKQNFSVKLRSGNPRIIVYERKI